MLPLTGVLGVLLGGLVGLGSSLSKDESDLPNTIGRSGDIANSGREVANRVDATPGKTAIDSSSSDRTVASSFSTHSSEDYGVYSGSSDPVETTYDPNSTTESNRRLVREKMIEQGVDADEAEAFTSELYKLEREFRFKGYISE